MNWHSIILSCRRWAIGFLGAGIAIIANAGPTEDFFFAVRNDQVSVVRTMLDRGFDPNTRDANGRTGLTVAMQEESPKVARLLIERPSIDLNALNQAGESALMLAALKGDVADARLLIEHGALVNQPGWSPLHYAASGPEPKLVELLLERGAQIDARSPNGSTPLMLAAQYGSEDSVKLLLARGADATLRNQRALTAADFARLGGRDFVAQRLDKAAAAAR